jgi:hypothetical protein
MAMDSFKTDSPIGLFEGDNDADILDNVHEEIQKKLKAHTIIVPDKQLADMLFNKEEATYEPTSTSMTSRQVRDHLDSISDEIFQHYRTNNDFWYGEYNSVILGACELSLFKGWCRFCCNLCCSFLISGTG